MTVRVVIADGQPTTRRALGMLVAHTPDMTLVAEVATGGQAALLAHHAQANVVVLDIRTLDYHGGNAIQQITAASNGLRVGVLVLTVLENGRDLTAALRAGALGFLPKDIGSASLLSAIRTIAAGGAVLSPAATRMLIARLRSAA